MTMADFDVDRIFSFHIDRFLQQMRNVDGTGDMLGVNLFASATYRSFWETIM